MAWYELTLVGLPRTRLDRVSGRLFAAGCAGLQEAPMPGTAPRSNSPGTTVHRLLPPTR